MYLLLIILSSFLMNKDIKIGEQFHDKDTEINLKKGQKFQIRLRVIPGTGYSFAVNKNEYLEVIKEDYFQDISGGKEGGASDQVFTFKAVKIGSFKLKFIESRGSN